MWWTQDTVHAEQRQISAFYGTFIIDYYKIGIYLLHSQLSPVDQVCMELSQLSALAVCN